MAITIDSTGSATPSIASSSTRTVSFTNTAGTFMVVGIARFRNVTTNSVTYNGVSMTKAVESIESSANRSEIWYLASPATGANNLVVTFSGATDDGLVIGFTTMTGVDNASPIGTTASQAGGTTSTAPSIAITTANNNSYIFDSLYRNSNTETATSPQTEVWGREDAYGTQGGAGSYKSFATAGATTMAWTLGASKLWIMCAVEVKESASANVTVNPSVQTSTFTIPAYTVTATRFVTVTPTVPSATFTIPNPTESGGAGVAGTVQTATFSIPTYTVSANGSITVTTNVQTSTFSIPAYTVTAGTNIEHVTVSPVTSTAILSIPTYRIMADYWEDKFAQPANSWSDKFAQPANGWNDKY